MRSKCSAIAAHVLVENVGAVPGAGLGTGNRSKLAKKRVFFFFAGDGVAKPLKRLRGTPFENHCSKPSKHVAAMLALRAPSVKRVTFRV